MSSLFKNIHLDKKQKCIYLWEYDTELKRTIKRKHDIDTTYFVPANKPTKWKNIEGQFMEQKTLAPRENGYQIKKDLDRVGKTTAEMNYDQESKFLLHKYFNKSLPTTLNDVGFKRVFNVGYFDIEVDSSDLEFPEPDKHKFPVNLVTIVSNSGTHTFGIRPYNGTSELVQNYYYIQDEVKMLERLFAFITKDGIDILSGWNSANFDIPYLLKRYIHLKQLVPEHESDWEVIYRIEGLPLNKVIYSPVKKTWEIVGVTHIDYMKIYTDLTYDPHDSYGLDYVAKKVVNKGKIVYDGTFEEHWRNDWDCFVEYNIMDTVLIKEINDAIAFIELYVTFAYGSLIPIRNCESSISQIEGYIIQYLHKKGLVLPDVKKGVRGEFSGAYVMANKGRYRNVFSFDATSLYPSIIMQWNISPETLVMNSNPTQEFRDTHISTTRADQFYRKDVKGIIPEIMQDLFDERVTWKDKMKIAKNENNKAMTMFCNNQQMNYKILANSFYGVLGHESFTFYNIANASMITEFGQAIIRYFSEEVARCIFDNMSRDQFIELFPEWKISENAFNKAKKKYKETSLVLIDTDSYYICMEELVNKIETTDNFLEMGYKFIDRLYDPFTKIKATKWSKQFNVDEYKIDFKREKIIKDMIIFARKKYVSYTLDSEGKYFGYDNLSFDVTGLEIKRTDTAPILREFAKNTLDWIVEDKDYQFINKEVLILKEKFNFLDINEICLRKGIKNLEKYQTHDPFNNLLPHTPFQNKVSMQYNAIRKELGMNHLPEIRSGVKLRYAFVNPRNKWGVDSICWTEDAPMDFLAHFEIDYDVQFQKAVMSMIDRTFDAVGWDKPNFRTESLSFF